MAKQTGLIRIRGKVGDHVYYTSKVGGALMREQNAGMSERVKTDPAYANTRLNASEFGGAGKLAGAIISPVSQRWRYILDSTATGVLAKVIKEGMALDTANPWGQRQLPLTFMPNVQAKYNELSKNEMPNAIVQGIQNSALIIGSQQLLRINGGDNVEMDTDMASSLSAKGADGVIVQVYSWQVGNAVFNPASGKYEVNAASRRFSFLSEVDSDIVQGDEIISGTDYLVGGRGQAPVPQNAANHLGGVCVIMLPYKVVSGEKYILQEHCAAYWQSIEQGQ